MEIEILSKPDTCLGEAVRIIYPSCTLGGVMQTCQDELLGIQYKVPVDWGVITGTLHTGGDSGFKYSYQFSGEIFPETGGLSLDFSEGHDAILTDFKGFYFENLAENCVLFYDAWDCEQIKPNVILFLIFPTAAEICDPGPGRVGDPTVVLAIDLPDNPTIRGFLFADGFLSQAAMADLKQAYSKLLSPDIFPDYQRCTELNMAIFDAQIQALKDNIKSGSIDRDTLNNLDTWRRIANSVKEVK